MLCVLSLALASVLHVAGDVRANSMELGQTTISAAADDLGTDGGSTAEACHSCSVAPYFNAVSPIHVAAVSAGVPEGRLVRVSAVSMRVAGPPPKN